MSGNEMKNVVTQTENEFKKKVQAEKEKQIKEIVQDLLEKIESKKDGIRKLNEEKKALETSLDDLKNGRLDKLAELLEKNPIAKEVVKIEVHKIEYVPLPYVVEKYIPYTPWNQPWSINYGVNAQPLMMYSGGSTCADMGNAAATCNATVFTSSDVKSAAIGTYTVGLNSVSIR
jgi:hypothetical protein